MHQRNGEQRPDHYCPVSVLPPPVVFVLPKTPCGVVAIVLCKPAMPAVARRCADPALSACGNVGGGGGGGGSSGLAPPPNSDAIIPMSSPFPRQRQDTVPS